VSPRCRCPFAGPFGSSTDARSSLGGVVTQRIRQMTLYVFPFCSSISYPTSPTSLHSPLPALATTAARGRGGQR
jgi:hypothetical protein